MWARSRAAARWASPSSAAARTARCSAASRSQLGCGEPVRFVPPGRHADQGGLVAQVIEHPDQQRVAAARVELAVEVTVGQAAFGLVAGTVGASQGLVGGLPVVPGGDRAGERLGLEQQPGVVHVPGLLAVHDPNGRALVRAHRHQARARQRLERLAHRGLADAQHVGQVGLDQCLPGLELTGQDRVLDRLEHRDRTRRKRPGRPGQERRRRDGVGTCEATSMYRISYLTAFSCSLCPVAPSGVTTEARASASPNAAGVRDRRDHRQAGPHARRG